MHAETVTLMVVMYAETVTHARRNGDAANKEPVSPISKCTCSSSGGNSE